jgi:lipoprotein-anchoring transpeptidase ErfK/SrfK
LIGIKPVQAQMGYLLIPDWGWFAVRRAFVSLAVLLLASVQATDAWAGVVIQIALAQQTMMVEVDGVHFATWPVSTARRGYRTPVGIYKPYVLDRMHYSSLYEQSPMPYSIFFLRGYAIHGTYEVRSLGRPVSHGCVRLNPSNARTLFQLIGSHGLQNTTITITK